MSFWGRVLVRVVKEPKPQQGSAFCASCQDWTERDGLPGAGGPNGWVIPTRWFCIRCGVWDAEYIEEESA